MKKLIDLDKSSSLGRGNLMVILDIDLDFFLKYIIHNPEQERPKDSDADAWEVEGVINFLEKRCKLSKNKR